MTDRDDFTAAIREIEAAMPDAYWQVAKGRVTPEEPLYGAILFDDLTPIGDAESDIGPGDALRKALVAAQSGTWVDPAPDVDEDAMAQIEILQAVANVAAQVGFGAGEPAMELAGQFVSVLAAHPELVAEFRETGSEMVIQGQMNAEFGCLSYRAINGQIIAPAEARQKMARAH